LVLAVVAGSAFCPLTLSRRLLIWNDLSSQLVVRVSFFSVPSSLSIARRTAVWVVVEAAVATVDHSDIRGSIPHNRDPSGAASD
jgi:hypothetical protein